ncbi:glycogen branching protein [Pseudomonas sp. gcc21]|uniref:hypothetical protein n=1 Tax=Pseudomonas sp. gcc21 TaxID=2726989 RepID=UPI0014529F7F|nr:glycogen branching protein [Pseudomonas sp. gcc21]QJD58195.1 glycogen branching protein [Pseudomonas sp. gcc21]
MPKHNVTQAFNYAAGGTTVHYKKGVQDLSPGAVTFAQAHGFIAKPKADKPAAEPAPAEAKSK